MSPVPPAQRPPNLNTGNSQAIGFAARTGVQAVTGQFIIEGLDLFGIVTFSDAQGNWLAVALTVLLSFVQNFFEQRRNRRFLGPAPTPAVKPEPK